MRYFGGKAKIAKPISEFLNSEIKGHPFVDLFCGSCNVISRINSQCRVANDKHYYLIQIFNGLKSGWQPPLKMSEEEYLYIKNNPDKVNPALYGFAGFGVSFGGKWWGGYARENSERNFCLNAANSLLKKFETLENVEFISKDYKKVKIPDGWFVYCDIPYKGTTSYSSLVGEFDHLEFYEWLKEQSKRLHIYVSEYSRNVPDFCEIVWEYESKQDMNSKTGRNKTVEVLYKIK